MKRHEIMDRLEGALKRAYHSASAPELGQGWQDEVMRAVRREAAGQDQSAHLAFRAAWVGALCSALLFAFVFRAGLGLEYEIADAVLELPALAILGF